MNNSKRKNSAVKIINPENLYDPTSYGYSHIAEIKNFSRIIHIAGQSGEDINGNLSTHFQDQVHQTFLNIQHALCAVNCIFDDIAVFKILVVDHNSEKHDILIHHVQKIWPNHDFPTCTLIPVSFLAKPEMLIEIDATAYAL